MSDQTITLDDVTGIIKRNGLLLVALSLIFAVIAFMIALYLPKEYKTKAILNIHSSYFQTPLVGDLVPQSSDPAELNAQRAALFRLALSDAFLDNLGEKYKIYQHPASSELRPVEREFLLKRVEYFSLSPSSYQIGIKGKDPVAIYEITKEIIDQMTYTFIEERYKTLVRARDAIQSQVQFLSRAASSLGTVNTQADYMQNELAKIDTQITTLRAKFTENHPELYALKQKAEAMRNQLEKKNAPPESIMPQDDMAKAFLTPGSKAPVQDISNDLLRKLSYLNIVLQMENNRDTPSYLTLVEAPVKPIKPVFPQKRVFALFGLVLGALLGLLIGIYKELKRVSFLTPEQASMMLGAPLFGALPMIPEQERQLLLDAPAGGRQQALPSPNQKNANDW